MTTLNLIRVLREALTNLRDSDPETVTRQLVCQLCVLKYGVKPCDDTQCCSFKEGTLNTE